MTGICGSGKTQLARHIAASYADGTEATPGIKFEITSTVKGSIKNDFDILADEFNLNKHVMWPKVNKLQTLQNTMKILLEYLEVKGQEENVIHILIFDSVTSKTYQLLNSHILKNLKGYVKIVITTNNPTLYPDCQITINGFTEAETIAFFQSGYSECCETCDSILQLGRTLSFLPLGISIAKQFIRRRTQTIEHYLNVLGSESYKIILDTEDAMLKEEGYDRGLISAIMVTLKEVEDAVTPDTFKAYEITAFVSCRRFPLDNLKILMTDDNIQSEIHIGDLIAKLKETSLGTIVTTSSKVRLLNTHDAVQMAMTKRWTIEKKRETLGNCLVCLSRVCSTDTQYQSVFDMQLILLPHVEQALAMTTYLSQTDEFTKNTLNIQVAVILLLETVGHMCCELSRLDESEIYLLRARDEFLDKFVSPNLKKQVKDAFKNANETDIIDTKSLRIVADNLIDELLQMARRHKQEDFMDLVLKRHNSEHDIQLWETLLKQKHPMKQLKLKNRSLSERGFDNLDEAGVALSKDVIQNILLPELFLSIPYSYGRLYCYSCSKGENKFLGRRAGFISALTLSHQMCQVIKERWNVSLSHLVNSKLFGLHYHLLDEFKGTNEENLKDIITVKEDYEDHLKDQLYLFQWGLLKNDPKCNYNEALTLKQLLKAITKLINYEKDKGERDTLITRAHEVHIELIHHVNHQTNTTAIQSNLSSFHNTIGDFSQFLFDIGQSQDLDNAINSYCRAIELERCTGMVRYPWILAIQGLKQTCLKSEAVSHYHLAKGYVEEFLRQLSGKDSVFTHEFQTAKDLLRDINQVLANRS